ncbi:MAG: hypothetical protein IH905_11495, partial [Proteobacteria bacterium]|nr:hypothetical protein [Pseudomonadota bacterium]
MTYGAGHGGTLLAEFTLLQQASGQGVVPVLGHGVSVQHAVEYLALEAFGPSLSALLDGQPAYRLEPQVALAAIR